MINSMTGYGSAEGQFEDVSYIVEIKAVNNRYFKARIKLPDFVSFAEDDIERLLREQLSRGTVNYVLRFKNVSAEGLFNIDEGVLRSLMQRLAQIASSSGIECKVDMGSLLSIPGIMVPIQPDKSKAKALKDFVSGITSEAIEALKQMRAAEGATIVADMEVCCQAMRVDIENVQARMFVLPGEYAGKLKKRVDSLLSEVGVRLDEETVSREVAIFADRSDISEELSRLESHIQQFLESSRIDGQSGRRLDFISQEMLREANTIANKANDNEIINLVVDMKCQIDRIKEQVQNVV